MKHNKKRKAIVLSIAMAALMLLPPTVSAQYDKDKYGIQPWFETSLLGRESGMRGAGDAGDATITSGITFDNFQDVDNVSLGSGIAIMLVAGLGYVALKKKEDKQ